MPTRIDNIGISKYQYDINISTPLVALLKSCGTFCHTFEIRVNFGISAIFKDFFELGKQK